MGKPQNKAVPPHKTINRGGLSIADTLILNSYKATMDALAAYFGSAFEFVLHDIGGKDLEHSITKIINGSLSGRKEGAPITDLALELLEKLNTNKTERFFTYFSKNKYGKPVKSVTLAIYGEHDRVIGLLCINMYLDCPITSLLKSFSPDSHVEFAPEHFISRSDELIARALKKTRDEVMADDSVPPSFKNKEIIVLLYYQGIFKLKSAIEAVSKDLKISKNTVYMHVRSLKDKKR
ncbi:MAG: PAS domain-containing protein [Treponema sp.]|jgi:predicted transcriptional regulator YheO|nr:PAS domain-containing protein [Treponema sp.]